MNKIIFEKLEKLSQFLKSYGEDEAAEMVKESFFQEFKDFLFGSFKELRRGNRGPEVKRVQQALVDRGFPLPRYGVDGIFGSETEGAVKDFQTANNLNPDGVVGKNTATKLDVVDAMASSPQVEEKQPMQSFPLIPYQMKRYKPFSRRATRLFRQAAQIAGVPETWAKSDALHSILQKESDGWVGIPNYTYGSRAADSKYWGQVHNELRAGHKATESSATGLGQLILRNVDKYYPSGRKGIGDPLEEAVGMLRYIKARYSSPEEAWSMYGSVEKTDPDTGVVFTEGY